MVKEQSPESFCAEAMADFEEAIQINDMSHHASYLYRYKRVENADKRSGLLFYDHRCAKAHTINMTVQYGPGRRLRVKGMSDELL